MNSYKTKELNYILKVLAPELGFTFITKCSAEMEITSTIYQHGEKIAETNCSSTGVMNEGIDLIYKILKNNLKLND
jgi:hypothetical protein